MKCHPGTSAYQSESDCLQSVILVQTFVRHAMQTTKMHLGCCGILTIYAGYPEQHNVLYNV